MPILQISIMLWNMRQDYSIKLIDQLFSLLNSGKDSKNKCMSCCVIYLLLHFSHFKSRLLNSILRPTLIHHFHQFFAMVCCNRSDGCVCINSPLTLSWRHSHHPQHSSCWTVSCEDACQSSASGARSRCMSKGLSQTSWQVLHSVGWITRNKNYIVVKTERRARMSKKIMKIHSNVFEWMNEWMNEWSN